MLSSRSHVASSIFWFLHKTLTNGITLFRSILSYLSKIFIGFSSYVRSSWTSIGSSVNTWDGSSTYFFNLDTWNTLCTANRSRLRASLLATFPIHSVISKGPTYLGLSFPFFSNLITPLSDATFKKTTSPTTLAVFFFYRRNFSTDFG